MQNILTISVKQIENAYAEAFRYYAPDRETPAIDIIFYAYVGVNHTIRVRSGKVFVRISDLCHDMPLSAHRGLAYILVGKLFRRRIPKNAQLAYSDYANSDSVRDRANANKRRKGRKVVTSPIGEFYDLEEIFDTLNFVYFAYKVPKPALTWSAKKTYRILGHHDATHDHIAISRSLDSKMVPRYVVEYIVYHEMLHIVHPTRHINGRRYNHTAEFRRDEEKFKDHDKAERWIEENVRRLKRAARRK